MKSKSGVVAFTAVLVLTAIGFGLSSARKNPVSQLAQTALSDSFGTMRETASESGGTDDYVRSAMLLSQLRGPFVTFGDRLEKRGKERVALIGALQRAGEQLPVAFKLFWELPGRLRFEELDSYPKVIVFNGESVLRTGNAGGFDDELLETLLYDSAEHLFVSQAKGAATRALGLRFRLSEDSRAEYSGPSYDIFQVTEPVVIGSERREQSREYFFNSDIQLLEFVKYSVSSNGGVEKRVEVRLENWRQVNGQFFAARIVRLENGTPILTLNLSTNLAAVSPKVDDGLFTLP